MGAWLTEKIEARADVWILGSFPGLAVCVGRTLIFLRDDKAPRGGLCGAWLRRLMTVFTDSPCFALLVCAFCFAIAVAIAAAVIGVI